MYTVTNYRTKKALLADFKAGKEIRVYQPNDLFGASGNGNVALEGPHYPEPHRWYASAKIEDFIIKAVK
jgi:hypothetical protein